VIAVLAPRVLLCSSSFPSSLERLNQSVLLRYFLPEQDSILYPRHARVRMVDVTSQASFGLVAVTVMLAIP